MVFVLIRPMCSTRTLSRLFSLFTHPVFSPQCCVFPAAVVLLDSWEILLRNLWDEHLNHSLIRDIKQTLDQIIRRNKYAGVGFAFPHAITNGAADLLSLANKSIVCMIPSSSVSTEVPGGDGRGSAFPTALLPRGAPQANVRTFLPVAQGRMHALH